MLGERTTHDVHPWVRAELAVFAGGLALLLTGIATPSLWRDEVATAEIARRGLAEIGRITELTDLAHTPYYLLQSGWTSLVGHSEFAVRLPSAVAMAAAAAMLAMIARHYTTPGRSVIVAVVFLAAPAVTRYGQEARSPALVLALITAATLLIHHDSRRRWVAYGVVTTSAVLLNVVAVLALLPHAVLARQRDVFGSWLNAAVTPACVGSGWALLLHIGGQHSGMLAWLPAPTIWRLGEIYVEVCASAAFAGVLVIGWILLARRWIGDALWLAAYAAIPAVGWIASHVTNVALGRYFLFVLPYLVLAAMLPWNRRIVMYAGLAIAVSLPEQIWYRTPAGHLDDYRAAVAYLDANARRGDAVAHGSWLERFAYDYYTSGGVARPLDADAVSIEVRQRRPGGACDRAPSSHPVGRVWFLRTDTADDRVTDPGECDPTLDRASSREFGEAVVELYVRQPAGQLVSAAAR